MIQSSHPYSSLNAVVRTEVCNVPILVTAVVSRILDISPLYSDHCVHALS